MRSAEVKARDLIQQTGAEARLRRSIDVEAPTPASPSVLNAKACGAKSTLRATLLLAALAATVRNAKAYGALSSLPAPVLLAAPAAAVRNAKVCSVPSTLRAPSCWQRLPPPCESLDRHRGCRSQYACTYVTGMEKSN